MYGMCGPSVKPPFGTGTSRSVGALRICSGRARAPPVLPTPDPSTCDYYYLYCYHYCHCYRYYNIIVTVIVIVTIVTIITSLTL